MSQLPPSFSGLSCSQFHLRRTNPPGCIMHKSQCLASGTQWLFFFCMVLLSWLRQNSPQSNKEYMLPSKLFPTSHTNWTWIFWEHFSWETGTTIRITFQATIKFDLLGDLDLELTEIWLEAWFHLQLQQRLAVIQLKFFAVEFHDLDTLNEYGFFLGKNVAVGALGSWPTPPELPVRPGQIICLTRYFGVRLVAHRGRSLSPKLNRKLSMVNLKYQLNWAKRCSDWG